MLAVSIYLKVIVTWSCYELYFEIIPKKTSLQDSARLFFLV